jgi:tetratricopeptide (TPR) repeat protein
VATHAARPGHRWLAAAILLAVAAGALILGSLRFGGAVYEQRGRAALFHRDTAVAEAALARGENLLPWYWELPYLRARVAAVGGDLEAARLHLVKTLARQPHYIPAMLLKGEVALDAAVARMAEGDAAGATNALDRAEDVAGEARALCPPLGQAASLFGRAAALRASIHAETAAGPVMPLWREGRDEMRRALLVEPSRQPLTYKILAECESRLGEAEAAVEALREAIALEPESEELWAFFHVLARRHGVFPALLAELEQHIDEQAAAESPADPFVYALHATALVDSGADIADVERAYHQALAVHPTDPGLWRDYTAFADETNRMEPFADYVSVRVQEMTGLPGAVREPFIIVLRVLRRGAPAYPEATADFIAAMQRGPDATELGLLGWAAEVLFYRLEDQPQLVEEMPEAFVQLGVILADTGMPEKGYAIIKAAEPHLSTEARAGIQPALDAIRDRIAAGAQP